MDADVIVVGAGPSGATVARELAARGRSVLILDRARFPRDKPCGGGVSVACAAAIPFDIGAVIERRVSGFIVGDPRGAPIQRDFDAPYLYMVQRDHFDALLLEHAVAAGAQFASQQLVRDVSIRQDGTYEVAIRGDGGADTVHQSRIVVGADGANSVVRRALGFPEPDETAVALEGRLPCPDGVPEWLQHRVAISPGIVPGGYGWLFPKGDHINVGVGGWKAAGPLLHGALDAYARAYGWSLADLEGVEGHLLPLHRTHVALARGGAALLGDAAGLVDPLTGGGIANAVASAMILAPIAEQYLAGALPDLSRFTRDLHAQVFPTLDRSGAIAELFYAAPQAFMAVAARCPRFVDAAVSSVEGATASPSSSLVASALWALLGVGGSIARQTSLARFGAR